VRITLAPAPSNVGAGVGRFGIVAQAAGHNLAVCFREGHIQEHQSGLLNRRHADRLGCIHSKQYCIAFIFQ
jgi:hypothetical protein